YVAFLLVDVAGRNLGAGARREAAVCLLRLGAGTGLMHEVREETRSRPWAGPHEAQSGPDLVGVDAFVEKVVDLFGRPPEHGPGRPSGALREVLVQQLVAEHARLGACVDCAQTRARPRRGVAVAALRL